MTDKNAVQDLVSRYPEEIKEHAKRVADALADYGPDYVLVGLLHDILEDTETNICELPPDLSKDIVTLTRRDSETYFQYIDNMCRNGSERALIVKLTDIGDHLSQTATLKESLKKRYLKAEELILNRLAEIDDEKAIKLLEEMTEETTDVKKKLALMRGLWSLKILTTIILHWHFI